jgi:hypothetical protein
MVHRLSAHVNEIQVLLPSTQHFVASTLRLEAKLDDLPSNPLSVYPIDTGLGLVGSTSAGRV